MENISFIKGIPYLGATKTVTRRVITQKTSTTPLTSLRTDLVDLSTKVEKPKGLSFSYSHFEDSYPNSLSIIPDEFYGAIRNEVLPAKKHVWSRFKKVYIDIPASTISYQDRLPCYHLDKLYSSEPGYGTSAIKALVQKSLNDPKTQGRVTLEACDVHLDKNRPCPSGAYYKWGFRFKDPDLNKPFEEWLKNGGKIENAPTILGEMYLPQKNIQHCLNYKSHTKS